MRYTDRSRIENRFICPRSYYWGYEHDGIGLRPIQDNKDLAFGKAMAEQTARIKEGKPFELGDFAQGDERALAEGLLTGYETIVWPRWMRDYDLVAIEKECPRLLAEGLTYNSRPDTIVRRKSDRTLWYGPEDKTTGWLDTLLGYAHNVQLHATAQCIEDHYDGERIAGAIVQGLYKGFVKEGRLYHSLVYAYVKEGRAGIVPDQWSVKWQRGWDRTPVAQYPGGVREWIKKLTAEDLAAIFPNSEPVTLQRNFTSEYFAQVVNEEKRIEGSKPFGGWDEDSIRRTFPQSFNMCDNYGGFKKPCWAKELCYNPTTRRFPMTLFKKREPHHENEAMEKRA